LLVTAPADAQESGAWPQRTFVTIAVPVQPLNNDFSESLSFADATRKTENVTFATRYGSTKGALVDVGAGTRLAHNIGVGARLSWLQQSTAGSFALSVPNPIVANRPFDLTGSVSEFDRREVGLHLQAIYAVSLGRKARVLIAGGPSVFRVKQDLLRTIEFDKLPGFTGLSFDQAIVSAVEKTAVGFNAGADLTWLLTSHFGVGTLARYSRAELKMDPGSETGVSRAIEIHAGGLHVGGGIRLLF
jgi:hypothetical protein